MITEYKRPLPSGFFVSEKILNRSVAKTAALADPKDE